MEPDSVHDTPLTAPSTATFRDAESVQPEGDDDGPWGRLISLTHEQYPDVDLLNEEYVMGRARDCHLDLKYDDLRISGKHCRIFRERRDGVDIVFAKDLSSNGTFLNGHRIGKGNQEILHENDELCLVTPRAADCASTPRYLFKGPASSCKEIDHEEAESIGQDYDIQKKLGHGNFAEVFVAVKKTTGERFAVKVIDKKRFYHTPNVRNDSLLDEARVLERLNHPNIVRNLGAYQTTKKLYLILELADGGDLFDKILAVRRFSEPEARECLAQLLNAVAYLHEEGVVHRDLKPENILLSERGPNARLKITDFGLARFVGHQQLMKTLCGTPQYLAPEVLTSQQHPEDGYGKEVDLWSMGVILYVLLSGYPPFYEEKNIPVPQQIKTGNYDFPPKAWASVSRDGVDLVKRLLTVDPRKRITIEGCWEHPFLKAHSIGPQCADTPKTPSPTRTSLLNLPPTPKTLTLSEDVGSPTKRKRKREDGEDAGGDAKRRHG